VAESKSKSKGKTAAGTKTTKSAGKEKKTAAKRGPATKRQKTSDSAPPLPVEEEPKAAAGAGDIAAGGAPPGSQPREADLNELVPDADMDGEFEPESGMPADDGVAGDGDGE